MDSAWKQTERAVAALIGGKRKWANSGEAIDCESEMMVVQVKLAQKMSLEQLTLEAEAIHALGVARKKLGLVAVKVRRGQGKPSPILFVMTEGVFRELALPIFRVDGSTGAVTRV
jgi:hypothetical protein